MSPRLLLLLLFAGLGCTGVSVHAWGSVAPVPSESECRPYIEKALKELSTESTQEAVDTAPSPDTPQTTDTSTEDSEQEGSIDRTEESVTTDSAEKEEGDKSKEDDGESKEGKHQEESEETDEKAETKDTDQGESGETEEEGENVEEKEQSGEQPEETESKPDDEDSGEGEKVESIEKEDQAGEESTESQETVEVEDKEGSAEKQEHADETKEGSDEEDSRGKGSAEDVASVEDQEGDKSEEQANQAESTEEGAKSVEESTEDGEASGEEVLNAEQESQEDDEKVSAEATDEEETKESHEEQSDEEGTKEETSESAEQDNGESAEADAASAEESGEADTINNEESGEADTASAEESGEAEDKTKEQSDEATDSDETGGKESEPSESQEKDDNDDKEKESTESEETAKEAESVEDEEKEEKSKEEEGESGEDSGEEKSEEEPASKAEESEEESTPEEDLTIDVVIPEKLRPREHINQILKLDSASVETELLLSKTMDITLRELKRLYDTAIQPLEILYKYRDLSNRHFGDPEIFSKPLILFMGPWSGGKSTIINYLLGNEYAKSALRTGAEPSPAYFNILMWGEQEEILDGTQLAADWTFSGLQKFGQGLLDRLRGLKLKTPLLEKVNIVEIPGILEIRKQVERLFPFNDACQWFIDRADIIFLVYDPSKLDVGPETEAILDQLKGREYQTRIILNKADQVKPEELMRVQGTLIWNISPLMSSSEPPVMYSTSLWSIPYEVGSPSRLLYAQERAFLRDLRDAIDKRVENKIASARRFAVRVRNHAKMVDCYLTTYYNHKSFFGNRKKVADDIIEHPQNYHIYEGLSTLTNISRYDLPDPEVYRDFFRLNAVYDFQQLSSTCTYFRGCPINRLDVAIAYDLPELVGKYKKSAEAVLTSAEAPPKS